MILIAITLLLKNYMFQLVYYIPLLLFLNVLNIEFYSSYTIEIETILVLPVSIKAMVNSRMNGVIIHTLIQMSAMYVVYFVRYVMYFKSIVSAITEIIVQIVLIFVLKQMGKCIVYLLFRKGRKAHSVTLLKLLLCFMIGFMSMLNYKIVILTAYGVILFFINKRLIKNVDNEKILINGGI